MIERMLARAVCDSVAHCTPHRYTHTAQVTRAHRASAGAALAIIGGGLLALAASVAIYLA